MMEMPDFLFIQLAKVGEKVLMRKFDTKSSFDGATVYVNYDEYQRVYEELKQENEENCRLLGMSAEREIQLLQKVQQLEDQVSCLMQNSESQTQTQIALIKKLEKAKWRPIETAPKDGTRIITCCMSPSEYTTVKAGFMAINGFDEGLASWPLHNKVHFPATHWMPLPQPPTTEETKCLK